MLIILEGYSFGTLNLIILNLKIAILTVRVVLVNTK